MTDTIVASLGGVSYLIKALENNLQWLERSFVVNSGQGSSAYANVFGQWSGTYPETTGYLLPTLYEASQILGKSRWHDLALNQLTYFQSIQNDEGWFVDGHEQRPMVFDNSQILLGICSLISQGVDLLDGFDIEKSFRCIQRALNDDGKFSRGNYVDDYHPSYYARIVWALLKFENIFGLEPNKKTKTLYKRIISFQRANLSFENSAFGPNEKTFTHTLLYTIRGLWESALLLGDLAVQRKMEETIRHIDHLMTDNGYRIAGAYDENWTGDYSFLCAAGHCQLALIKLLMFKNSDDERYFKNLDFILKPILKAQRKWGFNRGAIPSSIPIYGPYQRFKYTNWTQKFFVDALVEVIKINQGRD